eukprot:COSAG04_NODE_1210_length_7721_cov_3.829703_5_plen_115_part_00
MSSLRRSSGHRRWAAAKRLRRRGGRGGAAGGGEGSDGDGLLVVFCHGFQGNQYDLRYFRNRVGIGYPRARLLCCSSVEDNTHAAIATQGGHIAEEVSRYIAGMDDPSSVRSPQL